MRFFISFTRSLYNLNWLREETKKPGPAWSYFFLLIFFMTGLTLTPVYINIPEGVSRVKEYVNKQIPDFKATMKDEELSITGIVQPLKIENEKFVLVVDTVSTSTLSLKNYLKDETMSGILFTKSGAEVIDKENNNEESRTWKDFPNITLTKKNVTEFVNKFFTPTVITIVSVILFLLFYVGMVLVGLIMTAIASLIINTIVILKTKKGRFNSIFLVGLYALTLPLVLDQFLQSGKLAFVGMELLIMVLWLGVIVFGNKKTVTKL